MFHFPGLMCAYAAAREFYLSAVHAIARHRSTAIAVLSVNVLTKGVDGDESELKSVTHLNDYAIGSKASGGIFD
jgi:hypothetical protein